VLALPTLDARVALRRAHARDIGPLARVRIASWQHAYAAILPPAELDRMTVNANRMRFGRAIFRPRWGEHVLVAARDDCPIGYVMGGLQPDKRLAFRGEIYELYVHPDEQSRGVGRALLARSIWTLIGRGLNPVMLWVLAENPARHFYESCGGTLVAGSPISVAGVRLPRLAYGWRDALPLP
jgi:GNAT superfamily N-acetyltransferase